MPISPDLFIDEYQVNSTEHNALTTINVGGRYDSVSALNNTAVIARPKDRSAESENRTSLSSQGSLSFVTDLDRISILEKELGIRPEKRLAHNPAHERARFERAKTEQERAAVRHGV